MSAAGRIATLATRELYFQVRSPLPWALLGALVFASVALNPAAMLPSGTGAVGGIAPFANSRLALAQVLALSGLIFWSFPVALISGLTILRDDDARIGELLHSTPLRPTEYLLGKLLGLSGLGACLILIQLGLMLLFVEAGAFFGSNRASGPFALTHYCQPALAFLVPGVVFYVVLGFAVGVATRSALVSTLAAAMFFVVGLVGLIPRPPSPIESSLALVFRLVDPWGVRWLSQNVFGRDVGVEFYNTASLPVDLDFFVSRALAVLLPGAAFLWARYRFSNSSRRRSLGREAAPATPAPARSAVFPRAPAELSHRPPGFLAGAARVALFELRLALRRPILWIFVAFTAFLILDHSQNQRGFLESMLFHSTTSLALAALMPVSALSALLLLFTTVEALDRPRRLGLAKLIESSSPASGSRLLGTCGAQLVLATFVFVAAAVPICSVLGSQGSGIEFGPFLRLWLLLLFPTLAFWLGLICATFAAGGRFTALLVGLGTLAATLVAAMQERLSWLGNWPLWGALRPIDNGLFEVDDRALWLNRVFFLLLGSLLFGLAVAGKRETEADRLRPSGVWRRIRSLWPLAMAALIGATLLHIGIALGPEGSAARAQLAEYHRLNSRAFAGFEMARLEHVEARLEIEPEARAFQVDGSYRMRNDTQAPLTRLLFTVGQSFQELEWTVDRLPWPRVARAGLEVLDLAKPLEVGASVEVGFSYRAQSTGFRRQGGVATQFVLPSAILLDTRGPDFLPIPGLIPERDLDPGRRPLPPEPVADPWRLTLPPVDGPRHGFTSRLEITAPAALTINGVGIKVAEKIAGTRKTVTWQSDLPLRFLNLVGGRLIEKRGPGVALFHFPGHERNAPAILDALAASRRLYTELFGPLAWPEIKLTEFPDHVTRAQSFATNISFSENAGFRALEPEIATIVTAHEVAHQWWAHTLMPGRGPSADVLLEGLANYSTLLFLEAEHGVEARQNYARQLEQRFVETRRVDHERSLVRVEDFSQTDETVSSDKGAWVFWMLDREVGRPVLLAALRELIANFADGRDFPLLPDLIMILRAKVADPAAFEDFVARWIETTALPEISLDKPQVIERNGEFVLSLTAATRGGDTPDLEILVRGGDAGAEIRSRIDLTAETPRELVMTLPFAPRVVIADPEVEILQLRRERAQLDLEPLP